MVHTHSRLLPHLFTPRHLLRCLVLTLLLYGGGGGLKHRHDVWIVFTYEGLKRRRDSGPLLGPVCTVCVHWFDSKACLHLCRQETPGVITHTGWQQEMLRCPDTPPGLRQRHWQLPFLHEQPQQKIQPPPALIITTLSWCDSVCLCVGGQRGSGAI